MTLQTDLVPSLGSRKGVKRYHGKIWPRFIHVISRSSSTLLHLATVHMNLGVICTTPGPPKSCVLWYTPVALRVEAIVGWRPKLLGWRPSQVGWRPLLLGWRPLLLGLFGWRPSLLGWTSSLPGWRPLVGTPPFVGSRFGSRPCRHRAPHSHWRWSRRATPDRAEGREVGDTRSVMENRKTTHPV